MAEDNTADDLKRPTLMRAFVVRCFGTKSGIDFDRVHRELIGPALSRMGAGGGTTGEIVEAGNIREDMFEQLVAADFGR